MKLEYIQEFIVLTQILNYQYAAEELYISQSSLSKHIRSLEDELGAELFDRKTQRLQLTKFGSDFFAYAMRMSQASHDFERKKKRYLAESDSDLTVTAFPVMGDYEFTDVLAAFNEQNFRHNIRLLHQRYPEQLQMLRNGQSNFAFVRQFAGQPEPDLCRIVYYRDPVVALLPASHPFAQKERIQPGELKQESFIETPKTSLLYRITNEICHSAGFVPSILFTAHQYETITQMVLKMNSVSLLCKKSVEKFAHLPVAVVPIEPLTLVDICLLYRKKSVLTKAERCFIACAEDKINKMGCGD